MKIQRLLVAVILAAVASASGNAADQPPSTGREGGDLIRLGDSRTVVRTWRQGGAENYAISFDGGGSFVEVEDTSYEILLRYAEFDPLGGPPEVPPHLRAEATGEPDDLRTYIVQFVTQPLDEYRRDIAAAGGIIYNYLANHSYLVQMDAPARDAVGQLPYVRWVGDYHAGYKLEEPLLAVLRDPEGSLPAQRFNVQVLERGLAHKQRVAARINEVGGGVVAMIPDGFIIEAALDGGQLLEIARLHEVLFIDRWSPPEPDMNNARIIGGANFIETLEGFTGAGVRAEVMDGNLFTGHVDFATNPPLFHGPRTGDNWHGTATYGINFGTGTGNAAGRGMAPAAQGIFASYATLANRYQHTAELVQSPWFAVYQSNSWGSNRTTQYTTISHAMDDILFLNDILICQSQSNSGNQMSRPEAWAKNIVSVGGVRHQNTLSTIDDFWGGGASTGPAADGRIKPDLTHFYDQIFTTDRDHSTDYMTDFGGTSGATPITAGHFGLFFQMWNNGIFGNVVDDGGTVFSNRPHMATAKAMMINSASPYNWTQGGANADLTRTRQGWGLADLQTMYDTREQMFIVNEARALRNLERATHQLIVPDNTPELRVTLVYTDPAGTTSSTQHRINDLTLKVTAPSGTIYWGNNGLSAGIWSAAGGAADTKNTVENVFLQDPAPGLWTIEVMAAEVVQDSHVETTEVDADFALVVAGVAPPGAVATIDDATVVVGTLLSGGVAQIGTSNNVYLRARSQFGFIATEPHVLELVVGLTTATTSASTLDILVEGRISQAGGTTRVRLRNWNTNNFQQVGQYPVGTAETIESLPGINAANRVRQSDGRIELSLRQLVLTSFSATGFTSFFDHVQITVD